MKKVKGKCEWVPASAESTLPYCAMKAEHLVQLPHYRVKVVLRVCSAHLRALNRPTVKCGNCGCQILLGERGR